MSSMSSDSIKQAFERGEQANYDGLPVTSNPYWAAGDIRAAWWNQGWNAAEQTREEWLELHE